MVEGTAPESGELKSEPEVGQGSLKECIGKGRRGSTERTVWIGKRKISEQI
jgi:hypothetical protein